MTHNRGNYHPKQEARSRDRLWLCLWPWLSMSKQWQLSMITEAGEAAEGAAPPLLCGLLSGCRTLFV